jgi:ABC-type protease/lipase transport system fused ATPase/permease subunit
MRCADKLAVLRDGSLDLFGPREQVLARLGLGTVHPLRRPGVDIPQEAQA